jgi:hypothetical protein
LSARVYGVGDVVDVQQYRGYSKFRTHTTPGPYGRASPRSIGPPQGRCVSAVDHAFGPAAVLRRGRFHE